MRQISGLVARQDLNTVHLTMLGMGRYEPQDAQQFLRDLHQKSDGHTSPRASGKKSDAELAAMGIKVIRRG